MTVKFHTGDEEILAPLVRKYAGFTKWKSKHRGEICSAFNAKILSTVHVRYSTAKGVYLEDGLDSVKLNERSKQIYASCIRYLESICQLDHVNDHENSDSGHEQVTRGPQTRRQRSRLPRDSRIDIVNRDKLYLVPSDHVTILSLGISNMIGIFVSRFWVHRLDEERNFFMFLTKNSQETLSCSSISTVGVPVYVKSSLANPQSSTSASRTKCRSTDKLADGTLYYMYRLILYADDFNPRSTLFPKGSVGGLYMSPSSFHVRSRRSQSTIKTISVTPPGVSTNAAIDLIIDDLVRGSIDGIDCIDAFGKRVRVFIDVMGFIGDYPASFSVIDCKGHNATAPCTHCAFVFNKGSYDSTYAYTTSVTSCNTSYRRSQARTESLRELGLLNYHHKCLGMSTLNEESIIGSGSCPLLKFALIYNASLEERTESFASLPFQSFRKNGYSLNIVAPDHLITGLFKGLLLIIFIQLPEESRIQLQICLKTSLAEFGFQSQSMLYKSTKKKLVPGLSMSLLYCILVVLPTALQALNLLDDLPSKRMLINLHRFVTLVLWWPSIQHDGQLAWEFVHGVRMDAYHNALQVLACNFVKSVNKFYESFPSLACHVDRPNAHRLLELVSHTIPTFNHIAYICELVFESAHQPLKYFLSRNHTLHSHIYSVHLNLAKDWLVRIWSTWHIYRDEHEEKKSRDAALLGLIRLFGGCNADSIDWNHPDLSAVLEKIRAHVHSLMIGTVEKRMDR